VNDNPFVKPITDVRLVEPQRSADGKMGLVVLERVEPGVVPDYCVHGKVSCYRCDEWCWLGDHTYELVVSGKYAGICLECAARILPSDAREKYFSGNAEDHRRAEGPH